MALTYYTHGRRDQMKVALTFDDGPNPPRTEQIVEILDRKGARGSFFVLGKWVERWPEAFRRLVASGHVIGNHSYLHQRELGDYDRAEAAIVSIAGRPSQFLRAPYLDLAACVGSPLAMSDRVKIIQADVLPADYARTDAEAIVEATLNHPALAGGSIILLHDSSERDDDAQRLARPLPLIDALPAIIDGLQARGFALVGLDEMALTDGQMWRPDDAAR